MAFVSHKASADISGFRDSCLFIFPLFSGLGVSQAFLYLDQPCPTQSPPLLTSPPVGISGWKVFQLTQSFRNVNMHNLLLSYGCLFPPLYVTWHQGNKVLYIISKIFGSRVEARNLLKSLKWSREQLALISRLRPYLGLRFVWA